MKVQEKHSLAAERSVQEGDKTATTREKLISMGLTSAQAGSVVKRVRKKALGLNWGGAR